MVMTIDEKRLAEIRDTAAGSDGRARVALFDLLAMLDVERKRAEDAERKLAALVASVASVRVEVSTSEPYAREVLRAMDDAQRALAALREAHADAATVAERHDREVREKELRRMAEQALASDNDCPFYGENAHDANRWLLNEADRIERGET